MLAKGFGFLTLIIISAAFADLVAHGTQAQAAAKGVSLLWTPSLQAVAGQKIT